MLLVISVTEELGRIRCQAGPGVVVHPNLHRMLQGDCSNRIHLSKDLKGDEGKSLVNI